MIDLFLFCLVVTAILVSEWLAGHWLTLLVLIAASAALMIWRRDRQR